MPFFSAALRTPQHFAKLLAVCDPGAAVRYSAPAGATHASLLRFAAGTAALLEYGQLAEAEAARDAAVHFAVHFDVRVDQEVAADLK